MGTSSTTRGAPRARGDASSLRLFFALWPDAAARDALSRLARDVAARCEGRVSAADNLHVTLAFLGEVSRPGIAAIEMIGAECARDTPRFTMVLDRLGGAAGSGVAWLGTGSIAPELARLHERTCSLLADEGIGLEARRFRPHVTLARACAHPPPRATIGPVAWAADTLTLVASELMPGGPRYREHASWRFGAVRS